MYCYWVSYTDHTYNNLNKQLKCTVIGLVIPITLNSLNKQPKCTVIVLIIPTTLTIVLINNQNVMLLS